MKKEIYWSVAIAVGVFLGILAYEQYTIYRMNQMIEPVFQQMEKSMERSAERSRQAAQRNAEISRQRKLNQEAEMRQKKELEKYSNAACGINEDTGACKCIDIQKGYPIKFPKDECVKLAREATG